MALIVEDGTIVENANSYITLAYYKQYWADRGETLSGKTDEELISSIIKATQYIDNEYYFKGIKSNSTQELAFPRSCLYDRDMILVTGIPSNLKKANCEASLIILTGTNVFNSSEIGVNSKSIKVGPITTDYSYSSNYKGKVRYTAITNYLRPYMNPSGMLRVVRN